MGGSSTGLTVSVKLVLAVREGRPRDAEQHLKALEASPAFERHRQGLRALWAELQARRVDRREGSDRVLLVLMEGLVKDLYAGAQEWPIYDEVAALVDRLSKSLGSERPRVATSPEHAAQD